MSFEHNNTIHLDDLVSARDELQSQKDDLDSNIAEHTAVIYRALILLENRGHLSIANHARITGLIDDCLPSFSDSDQTDLDDLDQVVSDAVEKGVLLFDDLHAEDCFEERAKEHICADIGFDPYEFPFDYIDWETAIMGWSDSNCASIDYQGVTYYAFQ